MILIAILNIDFMSSKEWKTYNSYNKYYNIIIYNK